MIMPRRARLVIPGHPHHVTQRGNRGYDIFLNDRDREAYIALISRAARASDTQIWAWCLMPNHVHFIATPTHEDGLRALFANAHRVYTRRVNMREGWRGHLFQDRFHSFVMDERHLANCARYVELNPVAAGLVKRPQDWAWSSARAHLTGMDDGLCIVAPLLERIPDWRAHLAAGIKADAADAFERHARTGRPLGPDAWLRSLEAQTGQRLRPGRPGRRKNRGQ